MVTVRTGARLHLGFQNLSLAHERLYGGVGLALAEPAIELSAEPAPAVDCADPAVDPYVREAVDALDVGGASVRVESRFERHAGLGSGTQLALSALLAVGRAHDREVDVRRLAPAVGRGGRSGVGVATFERGGFVVDAGHPTERFTAEPPEPGSWAVPHPVATHSLPADWRFVLVVPDAPAGPSGAPEDARMRAVVERADPGIADEIATLLTRRLLPAAAEGDRAEFGRAAAKLGRLNGAWYADEQGGVYRPPAGRLVEALDDSAAVDGAGQSSWGPTVYGLTGEGALDRAVADAEAALDRLGVDGTVETAAPRDEGAQVVE